MNSRGSAGLILLIGLFLVFLIAVTIIYLHSDPEPAPVNDTIENITYYNFYITSNVLNDFSYSVSNVSVFEDHDLLNNNVTIISYANNVRLGGGKFFYGIVEEFKNVSANSTINLSGWSEEYYFNSTLCKIAENNTRCRITMDKKALYYNLSLSNEYVLFSDVDGLIQSPVICYSWGSSVFNILMDLPSVPIPPAMSPYIDECFQSENIDSNVKFQIKIRRNSLYDITSPVQVYVFDYEVPGFKNIGVKNSSILV